MYCNSCGKKNEDGAKFCVFCGSRLENAKKDMDTSQIAMSGTSGGLKKGRRFIFLVSLLLLAALIFFLWPKKIKYDFIGPYNQSGFAVARVKEKYGVCNTKEKEVLPAKYDKVVMKELNTESGLIPVLIDDGMEFLDTEGKRVFDEVTKSNINGYYIVRNGGKYGCVDSVGSYLTECSYKELTLEKLCDGKIKAELDGCLNYISVYGGVLYDFVEDENTYGFSLASKDNRYGYLDSNGKEIIPVQYNEVSIGERQENGKLPVELDGERNFLSEEGELLYTYVGEYGGNGLAAACNMDGYYGYIDENGETAIEFVFDQAGNFKEYDIARVRMRGEYWGYVNQLGLLVTDMVYDEALDFNEEGYALVKYGEFYNFINEQGEEVFEYISPFYDSVAIAKQDGKYALVDETGKLLTQTWYDMIYEEEVYWNAGVTRARLNGKYVLLGLDGIERSEYYDGILDGDLADYYSYDEDGEFSDALEEKDTILFWSDGWYGMMNVQGEMVVRPEYIYISDTSWNGYRSVTFENGERGVINAQGNEVVRGKYERISISMEPQVMIVFTDEKFGAYSDEGTEIFPQEYEGISYLSNYMEIQKDGKYALADMEGNLLTDFEYDYFSDVKEGTFIASRNGNVGVSDLEGNILIDYQYSYMRYCTDEKFGFVIASNSDHLYGCLNRNGQETVPFIYDDFSIDGEYIKASVDQKYGILNQNLDWIIPAEYDDIFIMDNKYISAERDEKEGIFDMDGNMILPVEYDHIDSYSWREKCKIIQLGDLYGVLNEKYEIIIPIEYEWIGIYGENDDICVTKSPSGMYSMFNEEGEALLSEVEWISGPGTGGFLTVLKNSEDETSEIYDSEGKYKKTLNYKTISAFRQGLAKIYEDGYYGFINLRGEQITPCIYDDAELFSEDGLAAVYDGEKWGYIDETGEHVTDFAFSEASDFEYGYAEAASEEGKVGVISASGESIVPFEYDEIIIYDGTFSLTSNDQTTSASYAGRIF